MVFLQITTRDESGALTIQGSKPSMFGSMAADGPPTTLSDTGIDRVAFLQASLGRDSTYFLNGTAVGSRDLFQVGGSHGINPMVWSQGVGFWVYTHLLRNEGFIPLHPITCCIEVSFWCNE